MVFLPVTVSAEKYTFLLLYLPEDERRGSFSENTPRNFLMSENGMVNFKCGHVPIVSAFCAFASKPFDNFGLDAILPDSVIHGRTFSALLSGGSRRKAGNVKV